MRFLIAGLGSIGERHFRNLKALGYDDILVYRTSQRPSRTLRDIHFPTFYSLEEALDQRPDVVLVTNPTSLHVPVALEAAGRGAHLFIDIPLSHSLEGTRELVDSVKRGGLVSLMGFNLRFHPCVLKVRELVQQGVIGQVIIVQAEDASYLPNWHPWEDYRQAYASQGSMGGGAILAAGVHELDYLSWIFGPVEQVSCITSSACTLGLHNAEESATVLLKFCSGVLGELHCGLAHRPPSRWCKVVGEKGTIFWDFLVNQIQVYSSEDDSWELALDRKEMDYNSTYIEEMHHLVHCIEEGRPSLNDVGQGLNNLQLALASLESAQTGRHVKVA